MHSLSTSFPPRKTFQSFRSRLAILQVFCIEQPLDGPGKQCRVNRFFSKLNKFLVLLIGILQHFMLVNSKSRSRTPLVEARSAAKTKHRTKWAVMYDIVLACPGTGSSGCSSRAGARVQFREVNTVSLTSLYHS